MTLKLAGCPSIDTVRGSLCSSMSFVKKTCNNLTDKAKTEQMLTVFLQELIMGL